MRSMRSVFTASAMLSGLCVCAIALLLTASQGTAAAPDRTVTVAITAEVESVDNLGGLLCVALAPGDIITGTYSYTLGAPDTNDADFVAGYSYTAPPNGIALELGGATTGTDPSNTNFLVELVNDPPSGGDNYLLRSFSNLPLSCGAPVDHIAWQLDDPTGEALTNTKLTKRPPRLGDFQSIFGLTVEGSDPFSPGSFYFVRAHVTSATRVK